jgi:hypothetical protein
VDAAVALTGAPTDPRVQTNVIARATPRIPKRSNRREPDPPDTIRTVACDTPLRDRLRHMVFASESPQRTHPDAALRSGHDIRAVRHKKDALGVRRLPNARVIRHIRGVHSLWCSRRRRESLIPLPSPHPTSPQAWSRPFTADRRQLTMTRRRRIIVTRSPTAKGKKEQFHDQYGRPRMRSGRPHYGRMPYLPFPDAPAMPRCAGTNRFGQPCGHYATVCPRGTKGYGFCWRHGGPRRQWERPPCRARECSLRYPHRHGSRGCAGRENVVIPPEPKPVLHWTDPPLAGVTGIPV